MRALLRCIPLALSACLVVKAQSGSRLNVNNPRSGNYGYVDASAVGPSGPLATV